MSKITDLQDEIVRLNGMLGQKNTQITGLINEINRLCDEQETTLLKVGDAWRAKWNERENQFQETVKALVYAIKQAELDIERARHDSMQESFSYVAGLLAQR